MVEGWQKIELEKCCIKDGLVRGPFGGSLKKEMFVNNGYCVYEQSNAIYKNNIIRYFISSKKYNEMKRFSLKPMDLIVSCSGTIGKIYQIPKYNFKKGIINQALLKITIDENIIYSGYFLKYFEFDKFQKLILDNTQGGAMKNLVGMPILRNINIYCPKNVKEQKEIANILSNIDNLIESLQKVIEKKEKIKIATINRYLKGEKRLKGYSGKWIKTTIKDISEEVTKGNGLTKEQLSNEGKHKCILYGELFTTYNELIKNVISHTDKNTNVLSKKGDILIPGSTTTIGRDLAKACVINEDNVVLGGDINIIRVKENINPIYIAYLFSNILYKEVEKVAQGTTIIHLHGKNIEKIPLYIPSEYEEQEEIVKIILKMDNEIELLKQKLEKYKQIKEGMTEDLLTGKVRLNYE